MSDLFPFISIPEEDDVVISEEYPLYKEVAWDFKNNTPIIEGSNFKIVTENEAIKMWIYKALLTPRYEFLIYSWDYGSEIKELIGRAYTYALTKEEAKRYIKECLEINPYIKNVNVYDVNFVSDTLKVKAKVDTIYGNVEVNFNV